eukprot:gb/GECG01010354.1/.p1 GENE.gb/GECG01010354.1/~~gb/GECG01010354.1/.p1  ORF type:complete len:344 (+),score=39.23 gb/GECG01010354.1/:1-1032(+)
MMSGHLRSLASFASRIASFEGSNLSRSEKTSLHTALEVGDLETIEAILGDDTGGDVNKLRFGVIGGQTALHKVAHRGFTKIAEILVDRYGADANAKNDTGKTPLHSAANSGYVSIARLLVNNAHTDVNAVDNWGYTPLRYGMKHKEMLLYLLEEAKADPNVVDYEGKTSIHEAVRMNDEDVAQILVQRGGANLDYQDVRGNTALHDALSSGATDLVRLFVRRLHPNPNIKNNDGKSASHFAVAAENIDALRWLIKTDADINSTDNNSHTPLMEAVSLGKEAVARMLIEEGWADPLARDKVRFREKHVEFEFQPHRIVAVRQYSPALVCKQPFAPEIPSRSRQC